MSVGIRIKNALKKYGDNTIIPNLSVDIQNGEFMIGGTRCMIEDGVAKLCDRSAFAGSVATQDRLLRNMLSVGVSLSDGVAMLTHNPIREHLPKAKKGMLLPDYDADLCLFDKGIDVKAVLVGGEYRHRAE